MKTLKTKSATTKKVTSKKAANLDQATIKAVATKVEKARPTTIKEKNFLYRFQLENLSATKKLTNKEEKRKRNKIRRTLKVIVNQIIIDNIKKEDLSNIKRFLDFYKENYILNDLSLKSLTNINDTDTIQDYEKVLMLAKKYQSKK